MSYLIITYNIVIVTSNLKGQLTPVNGFFFCNGTTWLYYARAEALKTQLLTDADLDGGPEDGEFRRFPPGLVGLQNLLDQPLDLPLRHPVAVPRLAEDVDALGQLVIDARLAHRGPHGDGRATDDSVSNTTSMISCCGFHLHGAAWNACFSVRWKRLRISTEELCAVEADYTPLFF